MAMFEDFRGFEYLYDARIRTEDGCEFPVHRVLLAMRSDYFRKLLCNSPMEKTDFIVPEIDGSTLKVILEYIYTGKLTSIGHNIRGILEAAYFLGIENLLESSRILATANLTATNCVCLFLAGIKNEELGILKASSRFMEVNFESIVRDSGSGFEDLTVEVLEQLLSSDSLNVSSERQIWKAIELWVSKFPDERKGYLKNLIPCIRFDDSDADLSLEILEHPLVKGNSELTDSVSTQPLATKHRVPEKLFFFTKIFISRSDYSEGIKIFITYDGNIDMWRNISSKIFCPDVILHGSGALVVMFETTLNVICAFDVLSKMWSTLNPLNTHRREYNVVKVGNHVYALGGLLYGDEADEIITTVERYNFDTERWEFVAPHDAVTQGSAAALDSEIYVIGSIGGLYSESLTAQKYNPDTDIWRTISAPKVYRRLFALVAYKKQLFILGGQDNEEYLTAVEVYEAYRDNWRNFEALPFPYFLPKAVIIKDILYIYDNHADPSYDFRCPPVLWDETSRKWQVVEASSPFCDLHNYQFCTIEDSAVIMEMRKENRDPGTRWKESPFFIHLNS